jgi:hypothetical protein
MIATATTHVAQRVFEFVADLSLPVIALPIAVFSWSLRFKGQDEAEDWRVNLAVSLKLGGLYLVLALTILLNADASEIWFLMRTEPFWGFYVLLLVVGTVLVSLLLWIKERPFRGIQPLNELATAAGEAESRGTRVPVVASCISLAIGWLVAILWLWSMSRGA